jgi:hypothetical protein
MPEEEGQLGGGQSRQVEGLRSILVSIKHLPGQSQQPPFRSVFHIKFCTKQLRYLITVNFFKLLRC